MSYLERNKILVAEIGTNLSIQKGFTNTEAARTTFSSVGSYRSQELGLQVYVGIKETPTQDIRDRLISELAIVHIIATNLPHLLPELPLFYGLLIDREGNPMGIVTEDFLKEENNL